MFNSNDVVVITCTRDADGRYEEEADRTCQANEELLKKNTELLGKLKKADNQIIELEKERRADKNQIETLKIQLHKATNAKTKQIICVTEEKEEEEDRSKPVEEEEYNCRDNMEDHSCGEEQPETEEVKVEISLLTPNKYCVF